MDLKHFSKIKKYTGKVSFSKWKQKINICGLISSNLWRLHNSKSVLYKTLLWMMLREFVKWYYNKAQIWHFFFKKKRKKENGGILKTTITITKRLLILKQAIFSPHMTLYNSIFSNSGTRFLNLKLGPWPKNMVCRSRGGSKKAKG